VAIRIGGRDFIITKLSTLAHDTRQMGVILRDGITQRDHETDADFGNRLLGHLLASGTFFEVMGGLLMPAGMDPERWGPEVFAATASFLGRIDDPVEKARAYPIMMEIFRDFFVSGRRSSASTPPSSLSEAAMGELLDQMTLSASGAI